MSNEPCPKCGENDWIGIQYEYGNPQHYDGVSEWRCQSCKTRFGRWTQKELQDGEAEPRFGGK